MCREPACEICGCTEDAACQPFGCAWDPDYRRKGRYVCTTPSCLSAAARRDSAKETTPRKRRRAA